MSDLKLPNNSKSIALIVVLVLALGLMMTYLVIQRRQTLGPYTQSEQNNKKNETSVKIIAVGDIACAPGQQTTARSCQMQQVSKSIVEENPEHVLVLGDLQYESGALSAFEQVFSPLWVSLKQKSLSVPGNHEYRTKNAAGYFAYWNGTSAASAQAGETGKGYYSTDVGSWHLIALNSNCSDIAGCDANSVQGKWLKDDLDKTKAKCTLAFWHHPRFTSGQHENDNNVTYFWDELYKHRADVVLNGHDHIYERFARQTPDQQADPAKGIRQFIAGAGGKSLYEFSKPLEANHEFGDNSNFGYLILELFESHYTWSYKTLDGLIKDQGSSNCSANIG